MSAHVAAAAAAAAAVRRSIARIARMVWAGADRVHKVLKKSESAHGPTKCKSADGPQIVSKPIVGPCGLRVLRLTLTLPQTPWLVTFLQQVRRARSPPQVLALGRLLPDSATATGGTSMCDEDDAEHGHQCFPRLGLHRRDLLLASEPNNAG